MNSKLVSFLFYIIIFFSPLIFFTDLTRNPYYFQIVFAQSGMVILWMIVLYKQKGKVVHKTNPFELPMFCFYIFAALSWVISLLFLNHNYLQPELLDESIRIYGHNYLKLSMFNEGLKKLIFTITNILLVYLFATNYVDKKNFKKIFYTLFLVGFIASIYGILQYFGVEVIWPKILNPFGGRCVSTFGNPNFLSSYLILLFPVVFAYYLSTGNPVMVVLMLTYFGCLLSTLTRSSWLGLAGSLIFFVVSLYFTQKNLFEQKKKNIIFVTLLLLLTFVLWPPSSVGERNPLPLERITETKSFLENKTYAPLHQRFLIWMCGLEMVKEKPFTGKGWGLYELFYPFYQGKYLLLEKMRPLRTHANNAHNEIIEVWAQTGTIGLGLYFLFLLTFFVYSFKLVNNTWDKMQRVFILSLASAVVGMLVDNMLNVTIHFCIPAFLYFFILGTVPVFDDTRREVRFDLKLYGLIFILIIGMVIVVRLWFNFVGEINYFKGFKYSKRNELESALKYLSKANKAQRYEVNNNYELANTYARLKHLDKAINYYYEALSSNCGYDEIHFNLATVYSQTGNLSVAEKHYTQCLRINPLSKEAYMALGSIFLTQPEKYLDKGISLFSQAVKVFPKEKEFYNNLGYLYIRKGEEKVALETYYSALKIDPNYDLAKKNYFILSQKLGVKNNPLERYEKLLVQLQEVVKNNKINEVEKICNEILDIFPNDLTAKFYLGNFHFSKNNFDTAIKFYEEVIYYNPDYLSARYNLSLAYIAKKDFNNAKSHLEFILSKDPNNEMVKKQLEYVNSLMFR